MEPILLIKLTINSVVTNCCQLARSASLFFLLFFGHILSRSITDGGQLSSKVILHLLLHSSELILHRLHLLHLLLHNKLLLLLDLSCGLSFLFCEFGVSLSDILSSFKSSCILLRLFIGEPCRNLLQTSNLISNLICIFKLRLRL
jgi:hypothetical protein